MMDAALFADEPMGLRERLLATPLAERLELDTRPPAAVHQLRRAGGGRAWTTSADIEPQVTALLAPLGERVAVVVNYDSFTIRRR